MSAKISALPACGFWGTADVFTGLAAGINVKCTRSIFLTAVAGEVIQLTGNGASFQINAAGGIVGNVALAQEVHLSVSTAGPNVDWLTFNAAGSLFLTPLLGVFALTGFGIAHFTMDAAGNVSIGADVGATVTVEYAPANPGDWLALAPASLHSAIDRIARVVSAGGATPIP